MDGEQFREFGKATVDYIIDYLENLRQHPVLPSVQPGYLRELIPAEAPEEPEPWQDFLKDMDRVVMPGMTHWHSPQFHAFYPTGNSYPGIVGEMLSAGLGCVGFSWLSSPACTELEVEMMNWLGKLLHLPNDFLNSSEGPGGGVIQGSASESTLVGLMAAKQRLINRLKENDPNVDISTARTKFVSYSSEDSNSSVEKAGILGTVPMRLLPSDDRCRLRGDVLEKAIAEDKANGFIPCYVVATLGTTGTCAFDCLDEIGPICQREGIWLHIDAAYAGTAFICPEYRYLMSGVQYADSFNFNPHKWMLINSDCSAMWVKNSSYLIDAFDVQRAYLKDNRSGGSIPDYRHWQIPLGRRFRSIKLWAVLKIYGASGIRSHIRHQVSLAEQFKAYVVADGRFEIVTEVIMGLVCFRIKGDNCLTQALHDRLMERKNIFVVSCSYKTKYLIRFVVCSRFCESPDVDFAWKEIQSQTSTILDITNNVILRNNISDNVDTLDKVMSINNFNIVTNIDEKSK